MSNELGARGLASDCPGAFLSRVQGSKKCGALGDSVAFPRVQSRKEQETSSEIGQLAIGIDKLSLWHLPELSARHSGHGFCRLGYRLGISPPAATSDAGKATSTADPIRFITFIGFSM
jgi:hypothetical protein